ncbi:Polygalacturonase [Quillaja saponaria]|uniref:Polygalacturonase n=1 Tax=Quillaja saponaria TaxID=32244 RepID=A0AAD7QAN9_QUISA|nr:Polygalacturonase [Quillaja saponaria]
MRFIKFFSIVMVFLTILTISFSASADLDSKSHNSNKHRQKSSEKKSPPPSPRPPPRSRRATSPPPYNNGGRNSGNGKMVFNVVSFGAVGNGVKDDTTAFKMAWGNACKSEQTATLHVPKGYSFMVQTIIFTGPCKSNLIFQVEGTIMPPDGPNSWPSKANKREWLVFKQMKAMSIQGSGLIDGRGKKWWDLPCKPHKALRFSDSSNLLLRGLRFQNSPKVHVIFSECENVRVEYITIKAPGDSPNTDGVHLSKSNNVKIYNSIIGTGDDCVSIVSGCHSVDIKNVTCGPSHGMSIGSLGKGNSKACVKNITVRDSLIAQSSNGVRIKTWQGGLGTVSRVTFQNIRMDNVRNPIIVDQYYCEHSRNCPNKTSAVFVSDILYTGIRGTYDTRSPPVHVACSDSLPCSNLTMSAVELHPAQGRDNRQKKMNPFCWKAYGTLKTNTVPPISCLLHGTPKKRVDNQC